MMPNRYIFAYLLVVTISQVLIACSSSPHQPAAHRDQWIMNLGESGVVGGKIVTTNSQGNVFVAGTYVGEVDFDPGPNVHSKTARETYPDPEFNGYLASYTQDGEFRSVTTWWAKGSHLICDIAPDPFGNVYLIGEYSGLIDMEDLERDAEQHEYTRAVVFLCKVNESGEPEWLQTWEIGHSWFQYATGEPRGYPTHAVSCDSQCNVYAVGWSGYIRKFNTKGELILDQRLDAQLSGVASDGLGSLYIVGENRGAIDLDPDPFSTSTANPEDTHFLVKLTADGKFKWAQSWGAHSYGWHKAQCDSSGAVYVLGNFDRHDQNESPKKTTGYEPPRPGSAVTEASLRKYDSTGNLVWMRTWRSGLDMTLTTDQCNNVYVGTWTTYYGLNFCFDSDNKFSAGSDSYVMKLNSNGGLCWLRSCYARSRDFGCSDIAVSGCGRLYLSGRFERMDIFEGLQHIGSESPSDSILLIALTP